jgi:hypothetical protein
MARRHLLTLIVVASVVLVACGGDDGDGGENAAPGGAVATITTTPALEPVVRGLVDAYDESSGAGVDVALVDPNALAQAVSEGSPVIAPGPWLGGVDADSLVIGRTLAMIAVPAGNPAQVADVRAFAPDSGLDTAVCGPDSEYGNFGALVLRRAGVEPDPTSVAEGCEADAVAGVASGGLDAALLFRNSVVIPDGVEVVNIPDDQNIVIDMRYTPTVDDPSSDSFQSFLASDAARQILSEQGLLP